MNCVSQGFPTAWFSAGLRSDGAAAEIAFWFWSFSWKTLPRLTFPVVLFSCLVLWPHSPCHSCFILIVERIQLSPVFGATTKWSFPSHPLCWNHTCSQDCCPAVYMWKQKKRESLVWPWSVKTQEPLPAWHCIGQFQAVPLHCLFLQRRHYMHIFNIRSHSYYLIALTVRLIKILLHKCLPFIFCSPPKGYWSKEPIAGGGIISAMKIQELCTEPLAIRREEMQHYYSWSRLNIALGV